MKFTIEKGRLLQSIRIVSKGLSHQSTMPILSGIHLNAAADGILFEATDLDLSIKHIEEALIEEQGASVVPGKLFGDIIASLPEEAVLIETKGERLAISCGKSNFEVATLNAQDFPQFPQIIPNRSVDLPPAVLSELVKKVGRAVSKDSSRAVLTGVYLDITQGVLQLVATDSYRLAISKERLKTDPDTPMPEDINLIITGSLLEEVCRLATTEERITIGESENQIIFRFGSTTFIARRIEGNYPNFSQIIPTQKNVNVVIETELLINAVKRVSIVAKGSSPIKFALHSDTQLLEVSAQTPDLGEASESLPAQIDGEGIEIGFNHQYIIDGLTAAGCEELAFEAQSSLKPGIFKSIGSDSYFYLTMPVRI